MVATAIRDSWRPALQTGVAAGTSWWVAGSVVGHPDPLSAPVVAAVSMGAATRARVRRFVEVVAGVSIGIGLATLLIAQFGRGSILLALTVTAAMLAASAARGGELLALQSAIAAILVFAAAADSAGAAGTRFVDALIGGGTAALVSLLVLPPDPERLVARRVHALLAELRSVLVNVADALRLADVERAEGALEQARATDSLVAELHAARPVALEIARLVPARRRALRRVRRADARAPHLDHAVRHTRVLARAALTVVLEDGSVTADCAAACDSLARAVRQLDAEWSEDTGSQAAELAERATRSTDDLHARQGRSVQAIAAAARGVAEDLRLAATATDEESP